MPPHNQTHRPCAYPAKDVTTSPSKTRTQPIYHTQPKKLEIPAPATPRNTGITDIAGRHTCPASVPHLGNKTSVDQFPRFPNTTISLSPPPLLLQRRYLFSDLMMYQDRRFGIVPKRQSSSLAKLRGRRRNICLRLVFQQQYKSRWGALSPVTNSSGKSKSQTPSPPPPAPVAVSEAFNNPRDQPCVTVLTATAAYLDCFGYDMTS